MGDDMEQTARVPEDIARLGAHASLLYLAEVASASHQGRPDPETYAAEFLRERLGRLHSQVRAPRPSEAQ